MDDSEDERQSSIDWNSDDELEILGISTSSPQPIRGPQETNSSTHPSASKMVHHFVSMGFSEELVIRAIQENGEYEDKDEAYILDSMLTYSVLEAHEHERAAQPCHFEDAINNSCDENFDEDCLSRIEVLEAHEHERVAQPCHFEDAKNFDEDSLSRIKENLLSGSSRSKMIHQFENMGFSQKLVIRAIEENGEDEESILNFLLTCPVTNEDLPCKKRKVYQNQSLVSEKCKGKEKNLLEDTEETLNLPNPMTGFGVPDQSWKRMERKLHAIALGPPYFYYENVAFTPKGVWSTISSFLYDVQPEFVDSLYFCAAARKRGYVHNLPIKNRFHLLPRPPLSIHEALPSTKKWWPSWDKRTKLNCLLTTYGSAKLTERIRKALEDCDDEPTQGVKKYVMEQCKKWNLVWVGKNKAAPLEPDEMEMLLGFPRDHTRGGGISRSDRYKALGNSFQVDTVAYHLSVLKDLFPNGINVLSLFSGIGGAEVALHRLGIPLNNVVSVEISEVNRNILRSWWEQTNQKGTLFETGDVQEVNGDSIEKWIKLFGGFDLVIGGSPCNNLAGGNRRSRDGLEGEHSSLFFDYYRILELVRSAMGCR